MNEQPILTSERLILRPFQNGDADDVRRLAGDPAIADTTLNIPHPYEAGMAEEWISSHPAIFAEGDGVVYAITLRSGGELAGAISLLGRRFDRAELGYWIGKPCWNQGYASEAARRLIRFGFEELGLNRIFASHFVRNPASGRVMQKAGMTHEGTLRQHVRKGDRYEDVEYYGILTSEFEANENG